MFREHSTVAFLNEKIPLLPKPEVQKNGTSIDGRRHGVGVGAAVTFDVTDNGGCPGGWGSSRSGCVEPPGRHVGVVLGRDVRVRPAGEEKRRRLRGRVRLVLGH